MPARAVIRDLNMPRDAVVRQILDERGVVRRIEAGMVIELSLIHISEPTRP